MRLAISLLWLTALALLVPTAVVADGITGEESIQFYAGNGGSYPPGDDGPALAAAIRPERLVFDSDGNLYVSELFVGVVRKIDHNGVITRFAGGGNQSPGDGGLAVNATLNYPMGIAVDAAGNVYIAEWGNHVIRKVDAQTRIIDTIAGVGPVGGCSVGQPCPGDGGLARQAALYSPSGVAVAGDGTVYIADTGNNRVRKIDPVTRTMQPVAGYGSLGLGDEGPALQSRLSGPTDVLLDAGGNLYVADTGHGSVRWIDTSQVIHNYAGGGTMIPSWTGTPALQTAFAPNALARDADGNLYIGTGGSRRQVLKVDLALTAKAVIGNGGAPGANANGDVAHSAPLSSWPIGVAVDKQGAVYVADTSNLHVFKVAPNLADLSVRKLAIEQSVTVGRQFHYGIEFVNNGPAIATNVTVTDTKTQGMGIAQASGAGVVCGGSVVITCTPAGPLPPASTKRFLVTVTPSAVGEYCNTVAVAAEQPDPNPINNVPAAPVCVPVVRQFVLGEFVAFGNESTQLGLNTTVVKGSVGTNTRRPGTGVKLRLSGVTVNTSSTVIADAVELVNSSAGEVRGNQITLSGTAMTGSQGLPGSFPLLKLPSLPAFDPGTNDETVAPGESRSLSPGRYGKVIVGAGATLTLAGWQTRKLLVGDSGPRSYDFASLDLRNGARVVFTQPPSNVLASTVVLGMNVRVKGRINAGTTVTIGPLGATAPRGPVNGSNIVFYVGGTDIPAFEPQNAISAVSIGARSYVRATIYAPNGTIALAGLIEAMGAFIGNRVIGTANRLALESAFQ